MDKERNVSYFPVPLSVKPYLKRCTAEELAALMDAMFEYADTGMDLSAGIPDGIALDVFEQIKEFIDQCFNANNIKRKQGKMAIATRWHKSGQMSDEEYQRICNEYRATKTDTAVILPNTAVILPNTAVQISNTNKIKEKENINVNKSVYVNDTGYKSVDGSAQATENDTHTHGDFGDYTFDKLLDYCTKIGKADQANTMVLTWKKYNTWPEDWRKAADEWIVPTKQIQNHGKTVTAQQYEQREYSSDEYSYLDFDVAAELKKGEQAT